ncbi:MAG: flippase-like domain-containing protein [Saprospiraceae bacterium]|nr:flippase-like domain-containing protein [Saprospiraceae bacterium]
MARRKRRYSEKEERKALQSFDLTKAILPVILGITVVAVLFFRQFDPHEFEKIDWSTGTLLFLLLALLFLLARISFYALRLRILSDNSFSFLKCIQLIFIWEFSSAVSPTNVGGSAVALFILSQEKIGAAKTTAIVIYTVVLDTLFFLICVPLWVLVFGADVLGPGKQAFGGWEATLLSAYCIMFLYGLFFSYGLFVRPQSLKRLSLYLSRIKILKRFRKNLEQLGEDIVITSKALLQQNTRYHISAFLTTVGAWSCRFLLIISLIMGITKSVPIRFESILELYARIQTMFVMMALTPTPGGAGLAELLFGSMLADYVPKGISLVVASIWRLMAYYFFLLMGIIIIPQWLRTIIKERKAQRLREKQLQNRPPADSARTPGMTEK